MTIGRSPTARHFSGGMIAATLAMLANAVPSLAQEAPLPNLDPVATPSVEEGVELDVRRRHRAAFDPVGYTIGDWRLFPAVASTVGYESNLFGDEHRRAGAAYLTLEPSVSLQSDPSWGQLRLDASGQFQRFASNGHANANSFQIVAQGRRDFGGGTVGELGAEIAQVIERRDSSGFPDGRVEPVRYFEAQLYAHATHEGGRLRTLATVDYTIFNFHDTKALSADNEVIGVIDQDARDQGTLRGSLRGEYTVSPGLAVFAQGIAQTTHYRVDQEPGGSPSLGGPSYTALVGVALGSGQFIRGSVGVGYVWRSYTGAGTRSIGGLAVNADLAYFVTPLVTLSATASRTVEEAVLQDASGYVSNAASLRADYELERWLLIHVVSSYRINAFRQNPRQDDVLDLSAGAVYNVDRHVSFGADAGYVNRRVKNDPFAASYNDFKVSATVRYSF